METLFLAKWCMHVWFAVSRHQNWKEKNRNRSTNLVKKLGYERWFIHKQPRQYLGLYGFSFPRYSAKCFTQIYKTFYGRVVVFVPRDWRDTNMVAVN